MVAKLEILHRIARPFSRDFEWMRERPSRFLLGLAGCPLGLIGHVVLPLSMGQVIAHIVVVIGVLR